MKIALAVSLACVVVLSACSSGARPATWGVAIHGGAGTIARDTAPEKIDAYRAALRGVLEDARARIEAGESALDVCERVVRTLEDNELFNAGRGARLNENGVAELDASIMDGTTLRCGAVAGVRTVRNPVSLARAVMDGTPHVLLIGDGAEGFATSIDAAREPPEYFVTPERLLELQKAMAKPVATAGDPSSRYGTVGCVVRDRAGRLAAATSTGGTTAKKWGRVGDAPIIGAGNYADGVVAVSCTGKGEEFIRHGVARTVAARMSLKGESLEAAADHVIHRTLKPGDGGLIGVDAGGRIAMPYNSVGMYRAAADGHGRFEVRVWER